VSENEPDLTDVLDAFEEGLLRNIHTCFPAKVESYDASKRTANLKPMVKEALRDEDDNLVSQELPILPNVPVLFPGVGPWRVTFPVSVGDWVLVLIAESSIGHVRTTGEMAEPGDLRRHSLSHAVAITGFFASTPAPASSSQNALVIGKDGGVKIALGDDGIVHLAENPASDFVALAAKVDARIAALVNEINTHTHVVAGSSVSGGAVTATAAAITPPLATQVSTGATKTKAT
jgi:hypothetical protein